MEEKVMWWLIDSGVVPFYMRGKKSELIKAGLKVIGGPIRLSKGPGGGINPPPPSFPVEKGTYK